MFLGGSCTDYSLHDSYVCSCGELSAPVRQSCPVLRGEMRHPEHDRASVAGILANDQRPLMRMRELFDGHVENVVIVIRTARCQCELVSQLSTQIVIAKVHAALGQPRALERPVRPISTGSTTSLGVHTELEVRRRGHPAATIGRSLAVLKSVPEQPPSTVSTMIGNL